MNTERITDAAHPLYAQAMALYAVSFPPHEQRESLSQTRILSDGRYHFDAVCDDGELVGEVLYWEVGEFLYIEHFCVLPSKRNKRYGQKILEAMRAKPLILEIDPPADDMSIRRKGFYERCGFAENPYHHVHPPYHRGNPGHELVVMSRPKRLTQSEYEMFAQCLRDTIMKNAYL